MKQLIVNADDLGADQDRNQGIAEAVAAGVVTSVSVLVNGPAFGDAISRLPAWQEQGVSVGLHLNLSEGSPVQYGSDLLTGAAGCFLGKRQAHSLLRQKGNHQLEEEVARELEAQIGRLREKGIRIDHLDGHQHVHVFPAVIAKVREAAEHYGILWLRLPEEPLSRPHGETVRRDMGAANSWNQCLSNELLKEPMQGAPFGNIPDQDETDGEEMDALNREAAVFSGLAKAARPFLKGAGLQTTDSFRGLYLKGRLCLPLLDLLLRDLPDGLTELMVHPGLAPRKVAAGPFAAFATVDRQKELAALLDPNFPELLKKHDVVLTSFPKRGR